MDISSERRVLFLRYGFPALKDAPHYQLDCSLIGQERFGFPGAAWVGSTKKIS